VLFVGNFGDGTVTLVATDTLEVLGRLNVIPDGDTPQDPHQAALYPAIVAAKGVNFVQGLAVSPEARTLYVSRGYLGDVAAFDLTSGRLSWRLQTSSMRADHIALSADGRRLFVAAITANVVQVIDTKDAAFVGSIAAGTYPHVLRFTPDGRYLAVGSLGNTMAPAGLQGERSLAFADADTLQIARRFTFDAGVRPFAFSADSSTAYLQLSFYNGLRAVDAVTGQTVDSIDLPVEGPAKSMRSEDYPNQAAHHGVALSADGETLCVAATVSNYAALLHRKPLSVRATVTTLDQPAEAQTSLDGRYCFVSTRGPGARAVSVIDYADGHEVTRIPVGNRPQEMTQARVPGDVLKAASYLGPVAAQ
jgi:DNA-binding beta-propeller fold protein YncE